MSYVDGFVLAVPGENRERFRAMASRVADIFIEHGALRLVENWGDDVPTGKETWFARAVNLQEGEVVCFSWVEWPSKEARDAGNEKIAADPRFGAPHRRRRHHGPETHDLRRLRADRRSARLTEE